MRIEPRSSNRYCVVKRVESFSIPRIKRELEERQDIHSDFGHIDTRLPATHETLFKVYLAGSVS